MKAAGKKQIFILDDDESVCSALKCLLTAYGFSVKTFLSADEFFRAVPNRMNGCLLLDIHMPKMDGWETMTKIIRNGSRRPVIMFSADKKDGIKRAALRAGAAGFLQKPFNACDMIELINRTF